MYRYDENFHLSKSEERIDRLMFKLNNISKLYQTNKITESKFGYFEYYFAKVCTNKEVGKYLSYVSEHAKSCGIKDPYAYLKEVSSKFATKTPTEHLKIA